MPNLKRKNGYSKPVQRTNHPHIVKVEGVFGGRPIIEGTGIGVSTIVQDYKMRQSVDDIISDFPHLTHSSVFDALGYYFDHQEEIDTYLATNTEEIWRPITEEQNRRARAKTVSQ